jgi:K+ transporter
VSFLNRTMMLFTVSLTVHFGSSDRLVAAEGAAVSTTMVLATVLLYSPAMPTPTTIASSFVVIVPFDCHLNRVHDLKAMPHVKRGIPRFEDQMYGQGVL